MVGHRNWLHKEVVGAPSLAGFKARLDGTLSNLIQWKVPLLVAGDLELGNLYKVSSNRNNSRILWFSMCIWGAVFFSSNGSPDESISLEYSTELFVSSLKIWQKSGTAREWKNCVSCTSDRDRVFLAFISVLKYFYFSLLLSPLWSFWAQGTHLGWEFGSWWLAGLCSN